MRARRWAWLVALVVGLVLAVAAFTVSAAAGVCIAASGALPVAAVVVGLRWHRPSRPRPWIVLAAGLALYWLGAAPGIADVWERDSLLVQLITVAGYAGLLAGVVALLTDRDGDVDPSALLEAFVLAAGASLILWFVVIAPLRAAPGSTIEAGEALGALAYPALDLAMFALAAHALTRYRRVAASLWLLLPALVASAVTDNGTLLLFARGETAPPWLALGGSLIANAFIAASALHPSLRQPLLSRPREIRRFLPLRIALLGGATLLAPVMILLQESGASSAGVDSESIELAVGALVITGLVVVDLWILILRLDRSLRTRTELERRLHRQATSDSLTDLPNRSAFLARLEATFSVDRSSMALLFCDLDEFKAVNDSLGHAAGDALLVEVGRRLRESVRPTDLACRLGGDEFAVVLAGLGSRDDADAVATRILDAFRQPFVVAGQQFRIGLSIGIAFATDAEDVSGLMRAADVAMYAAKGRGRGRFERYKPGSASDAPSRLRLRAELERAIDENGLSIAYQPIHDLRRGTVLGIEALVRWDHPELGPIAPVDFIPLAEASRLISPLGRWVLSEAAAELRRALDSGAPADLRLFVNVSPVQVADPDFTRDVTRILTWTGLPAANLVLEITEGALLDSDEAVEAFRTIRALGVGIAIDDFGTGYSSIGYLDRFPVTVLKIDRRFIQGLSGRDADASLIRMILAMASTLGLETVAEGIETEAQRRELEGLGCRLAQGFLFSRPMTAEDVRALLVAPRRGGRGSGRRSSRLVSSPRSGAA